MENFEKIGVFYLGKIVDPETGQLTDDLLLYESKNLTTHAVCLGMTGSGKTGLGITLIEEAALDKIPSIVIDPKGDLSNLLLTFPALSSEEFYPWVDEAEAEKKGLNHNEYAEKMAETWREGLKKWGEGSERIQKLRDSVDIEIYTPASKAGIPISILHSFAAPSKEFLIDDTAMRDRVLTTASSLLGLIGIRADPIKSREHILLSTLIEQAWRKGQDLDLADLIAQVQKPPFEKIGAMDINTFFPAKERLALSISLNNLLASPGFAAWMEGESFDIVNLLHTKEGKPKISILSIAHLSDAERMFFVTLLLNEIISWMRRQSGTSSLRALLYMDEIFGYFPPTSMPPSKTPMLTLLKQARAFGLGIVLCTQNPVDLDYKGLANCGTWFIGKLQTERDKNKVIEGLKGGSIAEIEATSLDNMLRLTGNRTFILRSIYKKEPLLFQTRWTLSFLRGPLTLAQIESFTSNKEKNYSLSRIDKEKESLSPTKGVVPSGITEFFIKLPTPLRSILYKPMIIGMGKVHYLDAKNKIDIWKEVCLLASLNELNNEVNWAEGKNIPDLKNHLEKEPIPGSSFADLPTPLSQEKNYNLFEKNLISSLYQNQTYTLFSVPDLKLVSKPDETIGEFKSRLLLLAREKRDQKINTLREKYAEKIATVTEKLKKSQEKVADRQQEAGLKKTETLISFGTTILGAILGKGVSKGTLSQAGTSIKKAGRMSKDSQDIVKAEEGVEKYRQQLEDFQKQLNNEIAQISLGEDTETEIEKIIIRPRKGDIWVEKIALAWLPSSNS